MQQSKKKGRKEQERQKKEGRKEQEKERKPETVLARKTEIIWTRNKSDDGVTDWNEYRIVMWMRKFKLGTQKSTFNSPLQMSRIAHNLGTIHNQELEWRWRKHCSHQDIHVATACDQSQVPYPHMIMSSRSNQTEEYIDNIRPDWGIDWGNHANQSGLIPENRRSLDEDPQSDADALAVVRPMMDFCSNQDRASGNEPS